MINFDNKRFRSVSSTTNSDITGETIFEYQQAGDVVSATYAGGTIEFGHLIGIIDSEGMLDIRYHHLNTFGMLMTGICRTTPEILSDGRIRLHETWKWTSGDESEGVSVLEEVINSDE